MSKLAEFRAAEQQLKEQLALLESLKNDETLQHEIDFETKLQALMSEYGKNLSDIILILDPNMAPKSGRLVAHPVKASRKARETKTYKHPHTGEIIETKGGNHKVLKQWKAEHGSDEVESWLQ
jgi:hypothetical protein